MPVRKESSAVIFKDVAVGLAIMAALIFAKRLLENTAPGRVLGNALYDLVQLSSAKKAPMQVTVVDLANMPYTRGPEHDLDFTDRVELLKVVDGVMKHRPCAIGIDIDFDFMLHPYSREQRQADMNFLKQIDERYGVDSNSFDCEPGGIASLPRHGHIFVGAHGAIGLGKHVFGNPKYAKYAAFVGFPGSEEGRARMTMAQSVTIPGSETDDPHLSLSTAVANVSLGAPPMSWALERRVMIPGALPSVQFFIDYRSLRELEEKTVEYTKVNEAVFWRQLVLIGRAKNSRNTTDKFPIPVRPGETTAGVYIHGCAVNTLLTGGLIAPSEWGDLVLDTVATLLVLATVALIRLRKSGHTHQQRNRIATLTTLVASIFVYLLALIVAHLGSGVLWADFALVIVTLWLHWQLERKSEPLWEFSRTWFRKPQKTVASSS